MGLAVSFRRRASPAIEPATATVASRATATTADIREDAEQQSLGPPPIERAEDSRSVVLEPVPPPSTDPSVLADPNSDVEQVVVEPTPGPVTDRSTPADPTADTQTVMVEPTPGPATVVPVAVPLGPEAASDDTGSLIDPGPRPRAETRRGPTGRLWSHRWVRVAAVCLAAALAVVLIIWGIRATHKDSGSSGPNLPPPSTTTTRAASSQSAPTSFVPPIDRRAADPVRAVHDWVPDSQ